jgi:hypothetical protein
MWLILNDNICIVFVWCGISSRSIHNAEVQRTHVESMYSSTDYTFPILLMTVLTSSELLFCLSALYVLTTEEYGTLFSGHNNKYILNF